MRRFLLIAHRVPTGGAFTLNDLAGGGGRVDEVARCASTAFTLSNDLRRDTELTILFVHPGAPGPRRIRMLGSRLRFLNPDERSTAALLKNALVRGIAAPGEVESSPGLLVAGCEPLEELRSFTRLPGACWLTEGGRPLSEWHPPGPDVAVVLCDPYNPDPAEVEVLAGSGIPPLSLGPRSLRSSQCIDAVHHRLDLDLPEPRPAAVGPATGPD